MTSLYTKNDDCKQISNASMISGTAKACSFSQGAIIADTQSSLFRKPKDVINFEQKRGLVYQISCRDCNAVYVGETGRSVRTRKREHADAVKTFNTKKSALSQHVMEFDHRIDWDNVKILKSESHAYRRRVAKSFLINQKACSCNVINRNDGANFPTVYSVFVSNK